MFRLDFLDNVTASSFRFLILDRKGYMQPAPRQELKQLVEIYSMRTRQLAEALALLGGQVSAERPIEETMTKIKKLSRRVEQAGLDLFAFVAPRPGEPRNE